MMLMEWLDSSSTGDPEDDADGIRRHPAPKEHAPPKKSFGSRSVRSVTDRMSIFGLPKAPDRELKKKRNEFSARNRQRNSTGTVKKKSLFNVGSSVKNSSRGGAFRSPDPGSPEVSCVGRIKQKHKELKSLASGRRQASLPRSSSVHENKRYSFGWLKKIFCKRKSSSSPKASPKLKSASTREGRISSVQGSPPSLAQLRGVTSSRREPEALRSLFSRDPSQNERNQSSVLEIRDSNELKGSLSIDVASSRDKNVSKIEQKESSMIEVTFPCSKNFRETNDDADLRNVKETGKEAKDKELSIEARKTGEFEIENTHNKRIQEIQEITEEDEYLQTTKVEDEKITKTRNDSSHLRPSLASQHENDASDSQLIGSKDYAMKTAAKESNTLRKQPPMSVPGVLESEASSMQRTREVCGLECVTDREAFPSALGCEVVDPFTPLRSHECDGYLLRSSVSIFDSKSCRLVIAFSWSLRVL